MFVMAVLVVRFMQFFFDLNLVLPCAVVDGAADGCSIGVGGKFIIVGYFSVVMFFGCRSESLVKD